MSLGQELFYVGDSGDFLDVTDINCAIAGIDVVELGPDRELYQTLGAIGATISPTESIPDKCPLILDSKLRHIGSFSVCLTCPHAAIETNFLIEL